MTSSEPARRGFPWGLTLGALVLFVAFCSLGTWQVQRLAWKRDLIARIDALQHAPARPIGEALAERDPNFERVTADCPGLASAPFARVYALQEGRIGDRLLSACRLTDGRSILVDRGYLPEGAAPPSVSAVAASQAPLQITGVLRKPDPPNAFTPPHKPGGPWFARDLPGIARDLGAPQPEPWFLAAETSTNPETPQLRPLAIPANISNRHLGYILTWYGLAAVLAVFYAVLLRQRLKGPQGGRH